MARIKKTILGRISGAVGDVLFRQMHGNNYVGTRPNSFMPGKDENSIFSLSESGFTLISIDSKELTLYFINTKGQIVYTMTKTK